MDLGVGMARPFTGMAWDFPNAIALGGSMVVVALRIATRLDEAALAPVDWSGWNDAVFGDLRLGSGPLKSTILASFGFDPFCPFSRWQSYT